MNKEDIKQTILRNRQLLNQYKVNSIALFGSYVRNEQKEESDIDLLVEFGQGASLFDIIDLQDQLSELLHKQVSIVSRRGLSKYLAPYILQEAEPIGERL